MPLLYQPVGKLTSHRSRNPMPPRSLRSATAPPNRCQTCRESVRLLHKSAPTPRAEQLGPATEGTGGHVPLAPCASASARELEPRRPRLGTSRAEDALHPATVAPATMTAQSMATP